MKNAPKILYLSDSPQSYQGSGGRTRIISVALLHQKLGYKTRIVCLVPLSKYVVPGNMGKARRALSKEARSPVIYIPTLITFNMKMLVGIRDFITFWVVLAIILRYKPGIIHSHGLHASHLAVRLKKILKELHVTADIHGASPEEAAFNKGVSMNHPSILDLSEREERVYNQADLCVFVSQRMVKHVKDKFGFLPKDYVVIPCATQLNGKVVPSEHIRNQLGIKDELAFVYIGSYRKYQMAFETLQLFKQIHKNIEQSILFVFSNHQEEFKQTAEKVGLPKGSYLVMSLERKDVPVYLEAMDIGFMLRENELLNIVSSPTKFAEYLTSGVPVITTPYVGDFSDFVRKNRLGFVTEDLQCSESLLEFIKEVKVNRNFYKEECKSFSKKNLTWEAVEETYRMALY